MTAVQVGQEFLDIPADLFEAGDRKGAIIDSGTTLAYLPAIIYEPLVKKVKFILNEILTAESILLNLVLLLDNLAGVGSESSHRG